MYMNTSKELAPEEDQGVLFALTKAPQYSNLDYQDAYGEKLDKALTSIPETDLRFVLNGRLGANQGIAGVILKPWDERSRSAQKIKPVLQGKVSTVEGFNAFVFSLPPLPASIGGLPVQMVISSTGDFQLDLQRDVEDQGRRAQERTVHRRRQRPCHRPTDGADRRRPVQGQRAGHHHAADRRHAGAAGRRELRQPLQPRRPQLRGDPAGAAPRPAERRDDGAILRQVGGGRPGAALEPDQGHPDHRGERADPLQSA